MSDPKKIKIQPFFHEHFLSHEDNPAQTFRTYNPEKKCDQVKDSLTAIYDGIGVLGLAALATLPATGYIVPVYAGLGAMGFFLNQIRAFEQHRQPEEKGTEIEKRIAGKLWEKFWVRGITLYSVLDIERFGFDSRLYVDENGKKQDLDIFARFPSGESFKILVESKGDAIITCNEKNQTMRYKHRNSKSRGKISPNPIEKVKELEKLLLNKTPQIVRKPSTKIIVFASPATIEEHDEHLYERFGEQKFIKINDKNNEAVYVVTEDELPSLVEAKLSKKEKRVP